MNIKWMGAIMVISVCGGWGIAMSSAYRRQERLLRKLLRVLQMMRWEIRYRLTDLPSLCKLAAKDCGGILRDVLLDLSRELTWNSTPDASGCMVSVLSRYAALPSPVKRILRHLGKIMGRYDLEGQLEGMECVISECRRELKELLQGRDVRLKSYKTLGFCAGAALVILFI